MSDRELRQEMISALRIARILKFELAERMRGIPRQAAVASTDPAPEIPAPTTAQPETNSRSGPKGKANR